MLKQFCQCGFSLLETLVVLGLMSGLLTQVFSQMHRVLENNYMISYQHRVVQAIRLARFSAVISHRRVIYCGSANQKTCDGRWSDGQLVQYAGGGEVIRAYPALSLGYVMQWKGTAADGLSISSSGFTLGHQGRFDIMGDRIGVHLIVLRSGRVRVVAA